MPPWISKMFRSLEITSKERTKNAQFIIISLRSNMIELADYLVGICKTYNCTKSVTVDSRKYYERNGITPATQIISKNLYSAQMQKFWTQSQHKERYTTPSTNNGEAAYKNQETNINTLNLPDLGLCLTPEKQTLQNEHTNASNRLSTDDSNTDIPLRKKRKSQNGLCHTQHILL